MYKFFNKKGVEVFCSEDLKEVEDKAKEYKLKKKKPVGIYGRDGKFLKWI